MSRYILVPMDDDGAQVKSLALPAGLVCNNVYDNLKHNVKDVQRLKSLISKLASNQISESEDGTVICRDRQLKGIKLRDVLKDICNNKFRAKHEDFYEMLRGFNIVL